MQHVTVFVFGGIRFTVFAESIHDEAYQQADRAHQAELARAEHVRQRDARAEQLNAEIAQAEQLRQRQLGTTRVTRPAGPPYPAFDRGPALSLRPSPRSAPLSLRRVPQARSERSRSRSQRSVLVTPPVEAASSQHDGRQYGTCWVCKTKEGIRFRSNMCICTECWESMPQSLKDGWYERHNIV